jgi:hypothetical protein
MTHMSSDFMEHRWGTRMAMNVPAVLQCADGSTLAACVKDASLSGAYLDTDARLPVLSRVSVALNARTAEALDASVVRVDNSGIAIEWLDPADAAEFFAARSYRPSQAASLPSRLQSLQSHTPTSGEHP